MGQIDDLLFETERRSILFHKDTSMPNGTQLGYDGDPNFAVAINSDGEFLLHYCPSGTRFIQKNVTPFLIWEKLADAPGGIWISAWSGDYNNVMVLPTLIAIGGNRVVSIKDQYACYANADDADLPALGISVRAVSPGSDLDVQTSGEMDIPGATFLQNKFIFVGVNGTLTQTPIGTEYIQKVGIARTPEIILIDISQPIYR